MIDILNSNKEYTIKVRFEQGGADGKLILRSLIGSILNGDTLSISSEIPELHSILLASDARQEKDNSVVGIVMGMTRAEAEAITESDAPTTSEIDDEVEYD